MDTFVSSEGLNGQVAIVTGGGRGIGRAIAQRLATARTAVAVVARSPDQLTQTVDTIVSGGGEAIAVQADVTRRREVERLVAKVARDLGPPTLLINNAGSLNAIGPTWEVDHEAWWRDVEVSLRGAFLCSRAVLPGMIERRFGRIVNMTSLFGARPSPYTTGYACAKAAVFRLTEGLAAETASYGVRVFAISPGWVRTDMTEGLLRSPEGRRWLPELQDLPQGEWVGAGRAADLVVSLAQGHADALSGRYIYALDDVSALARRAEEILKEDLYTLRLRR
jgi:NAD(P)-dependent dehydrogenase (short-subunit alcohol dehydrogenase family)